MKQLAIFFLKIGFFGFGGPYAHIALMQRTWVEQKKLMSQDDFADSLALATMLPGPTSIQLSMMIGYHLYKLKGAVVAGLSTMVPALLLLVILALAYDQVSDYAVVFLLLHGASAAMIAIILIAIYSMGKDMVSNWLTFAIAALSYVLTFTIGLPIMLTLILMGGLGWVLSRVSNQQFVIEPVSMLVVFLFLLQIGFFSFADGLSIIPFVQQQAIAQWGWLSESQLLMGLTFSTIVGSSLINSIAFIGYQLAGSLGALLSMITIFIPSLLLVAIGIKFFKRFSQSDQAKSILKVIHASGIGIVLAGVIPLMDATLIDIYSIAIFFSSILLLLFTKLQPVTIIIFSLVVSFGVYVVL